MKVRLGNSFLRYFLLEAIAKSVLLFSIATFCAYTIVSLGPGAEKTDVSIRSEADSVGLDSTVGYSLALPNAEGGTASRRYPSDYFAWYAGFLRGDLGSALNGQRIGEELAIRLPVTALLCLASLIPALFVAFILGIVRKRSTIAFAGNVVVVLASLPAFLLGYVLFGLFGANYLLAVITLGLSCGIIGELGAAVRGAMEAELEKDYIETAHVKGLKDSPVPLAGNVGFHAFRNALITIVPRICSLIPFVVSWSMVVEQVFRLRGLSYMLLGGLANRDMKRVLAVVLLVVALTRLGALATNVIYVYLNPKYRHAPATSREE